MEKVAGLDVYLTQQLTKRVDKEKGLFRDEADHKTRLGVRAALELAREEFHVMIAKMRLEITIEIKN